MSKRFGPETFFSAIWTLRLLEWRRYPVCNLVHRLSTFHGKCVWKAWVQGYPVCVCVCVPFPEVLFQLCRCMVAGEQAWWHAMTRLLI